MKDRAMQALYLLALEPVAETTADRRSFGFRPERATADAIGQCFNVLSRKATPQWILEGDIKGCFDNISHEWLLANTLIDRKILEKWLRAGFIENRQLFPTEAGTPQGGIISPTLANLVLDGLEAKLKTACGINRRINGTRTRLKINYVRYADDCAPRRRTRGCKFSVPLCCTRDGGRPLGAGVQAQAPNHLLLRRSRGAVVSKTGNGWARPGQVRIVKSNVSEPLMTCRKRRDDVETAGESLLRDKSGGSLMTARTASGIKAARARSRLLCGTWEPVPPMAREKRKGKPPECESTDAGNRGGATRSSGEGPVMGLERRGCPIWREERTQLATGGCL
jgi:hypothetical protein